MGGATTARQARNLAVDLYRVSGVVLIVLGHWMVGSVTYHSGQFGRQNPLVDLPWTQWLTWIFQAVPVFFLVAGYASGISWARHRVEDDFTRHAWTRHRLARVLGPTAVYVALVWAVVAVADFLGVSASPLDYAGWAVAMHLWFLAIYMVVVSLTPIAVAAQGRWGLGVPAALALGVLALDAASVHGHIPYVGWLNYVFCWGLLYQLGIAWHGGLLTGLRPPLLVAGSAAALTLLIWRGGYPVSMIGVPGQAIENTTPPTVAMLAFGCAEAGLAIALAPAVHRALRAAWVRRALSVANSNVMALYLWHMIPVVIVAVIAYPAGLLPQPAEGSAAWWLARLEWVAMVSVVAGVEMVVLGWQQRIFGSPLPTLAIRLPHRWGEAVTLVGAALAVYSLEYLAADGFAPNGRFPSTTAVAFAAGLILVMFRPADPRPSR